MGEQEDNAQAKPPNGERAHHEPEDFGVLLGWRADPAGEQIGLQLQSAKRRPGKDGDVHLYRYFISKEQAVLLGNHLFQLAGATAPTRAKPRLLDRIFNK